MGTKNIIGELTINGSRVVTEDTMPTPKLYAPIITISGSTLTIKNPAKNKDYVDSYDIYYMDTGELLKNIKRTTVDLSWFNLPPMICNIAAKAKSITFNNVRLYGDSDFSNTLKCENYDLPVLREYDNWYRGTIDKSTITEITFDNTYQVTGNETESWDASLYDNQSVMCYLNGTNLTIKPIFSKNIVRSFACSGMFGGFSSLTTINNLTALNTSFATDMTAMFQSCSSLTSLDVSNFDTSNVMGMDLMFEGCSSLTSLDLSGFDTSNTIEMSGMFNECYELVSLDLSSFNTPNVTDMSGMFSNCPLLTSLDLSGFDTSNVIDMSGMFSGCYELVSLDLSSFNTSNVIDMSGMFNCCAALIALDLSSFNTSNVIDMSAMFESCYSLASLEISNFNTSNVTKMSYMFFGSENLILDCSSLNWDVTNVTKYTDFNTNAPNVTPPVWVN